MAAQTVLFDFTVDPVRTSDPKERQEIAKVLRHELECLFPQLEQQYQMPMDDGYFAVLTENKETIITVRIFGQGLVTINLEYYLEDGKEQLLSFDVRLLLWNFLFYSNSYVFVLFIYKFSIYVLYFKIFFACLIICFLVYHSKKVIFNHYLLLQSFCCLENKFPPCFYLKMVFIRICPAAVAGLHSYLSCFCILWRGSLVFSFLVSVFPSSAPSRLTVTFGCSWRTIVERVSFQVHKQC